ncbi:hypothetical protein AC1031_015725 [Aphanomyces cochlioides]|nr:hypothetical protein AC1031_015725 [Aphanomyces cochlioides]
MRRSLRVACRETLTAAVEAAPKAVKKRASEVKVEVEVDAKTTKRTKKEKKEVEVEKEMDVKVVKVEKVKTVKKSKKQEDKEGQNATYAAFLAKRRQDTAHSRKLVGAHVSGAGGLENAIFNAAKIGARSFALFTRSQRTWTCKPLTDDTIQAFKQAMKDFGYSPNDVVPHGSYLLNCGSPDPDTLQKSREGLLDEVQRCEQLGLSLYNFHPGSTKGEIPVDECLQLIAESIETTLDKTHNVTILIENMSNQGSTVGGQFTELRDIINRISEKHRSRVGVCLDTCHAFAAGWDLRDDTYEATMKQFDETIGLSYLKAVHLNDSKGALGCHADRHEKIGQGKIGIEPFRRLMNDPRFDGIPMVLETPFVDDEGYEREISLLYSLVE